MIEENTPQICAVHVFHDNGPLPSNLSQPIYLDNGSVAKESEEASFVSETLGDLLVGGHLRVQDL